MVASNLDLQQKKIDINFKVLKVHALKFSREVEKEEFSYY
jgi:hypothetical protein